MIYASTISIIENCATCSDPKWDEATTFDLFSFCYLGQGFFNIGTTSISNDDDDDDE